MGQSSDGTPVSASKKKKFFSIFTPEVKSAGKTTEVQQEGKKGSEEHLVKLRLSPRSRSKLNGKSPATCTAALAPVFLRQGSRSHETGQGAALAPSAPTTIVAQSTPPPVKVQSVPMHSTFSESSSSSSSKFKHPPWPDAIACHVGHHMPAKRKLNGSSNVQSPGHVVIETQTVQNGSCNEFGSSADSCVAALTAQLHDDYSNVKAEMNLKRKRYPTGVHGPYNYKIPTTTLEWYLDASENVLRDAFPLRNAGRIESKTCEWGSQSDLWSCSSAPRSAGQCIGGNGDNKIAAEYLRDWLKHHVISSDSTFGSDTLRHIRRRVSPKKKRHRKRANSLEGFIVGELTDDGDLTESTVEDAFNFDAAWKRSAQARRVNVILEDKVDETLYVPDQSKADISEPTLWDAFTMPMAQKPPWVPATSLTNAILLLGPSGSCKTSMVYAVAAELGWEVFELNASCRRSKVDIERLIGMIGDNHIVDTNTVNGPTDTSATSRSVKSTKQSLILVDDADVIFDDDRAFWSTILSIMEKSKRPLVFTAHRGDALPLNELPLQNILHLRATSLGECLRLLQEKALERNYLPDPGLIYEILKSSESTTSTSAHQVAEHHLTHTHLLLTSGTGYDVRKALNQLQFICQEIGRRDNFLKPRPLSPRLLGQARYNFVLQADRQRPVRPDLGFKSSSYLDQIRQHSKLSSYASQSDIARSLQLALDAKNSTTAHHLNDTVLTEQGLSSLHDDACYADTAAFQQPWDLLETLAEVNFDRMERIAAGARDYCNSLGKGAQLYFDRMAWQPSTSEAAAEIVDWIRTIAGCDEDKALLIQSLADAGMDPEALLLQHKGKRLTRAQRHQEYQRVANWPSDFVVELMMSRIGTSYHLQYLDQVTVAEDSGWSRWQNVWRSFHHSCQYYAETKSIYQYRMLASATDMSYLADGLIPQTHHRTET